MPAAEKYYAEVHKLMEQAWKDLRAEGQKDVPYRLVQKALNVPLATLHGWRHGTKKPTKKRIPAIAKFFYPKNPAKRVEFEKELAEARLAEPRTRGSEMLAALRQGGPYTVAVIDYGVFAWRNGRRDGGFWDHLFRHFSAYAGIPGDIIDQSPTTLNDAMELVCSKKQRAAALGVLETPDRSLHAKFFTSPIRIPVNAVILTGGDRSDERAEEIEVLKEDVARALLGGTGPRGKPDSVIRPIINQKEVGGLHVINFLSFASSRYDAVEFSLENYSKRLKMPSALSGRTDKPEPTAVVVADEVTCAQLIMKIGPDNGPKLVFEPGNREANYGAKGSHMPSYKLGFFVNREEIKLIDYLSDAFSCFLESNTELIASLYATLHNDLQTDVGPACKAFATCDNIGPSFWLGMENDGKGKLHSRSFLTGPWAPILERAAQIINGDTPSYNVTNEKSKTTKSK